MASELDHGVSKIYQLPSLNSQDLDDDFFNDSQIDNIIDKENEISEELSEGLILNPFYVSSKNNTTNQISDFDIFTKFKRALVICQKSGCETAITNLSVIYQKIIKNSDLEELSKYYTLVNVSVKLLKNKFHRTTALIIERPILTIFNNANISLENQEIVIPCLDLKEENIIILNHLSESPNNFNDLITLNVLLKYYNYNSYVNIERLSKFCDSVRESDYWINIYHCNINLTNAFQNRTFKYKEQISGEIKAAITGRLSKIQDKDTKNIIEKLTSKKTDYNLSNIYRKPIFTDASTALKEKKYKLYKIDNNALNLTKEQVNEIFKSTNDHKLLFHMFNSFLISKTHCHLVLNNKFILDKMQPFFKGKFLAFYQYLFGYPWTCMYFEECIIKTRTTINNRFVFDINTASKLPFFPYCHENIHYNPYCVLNVDEKILKSKENNHGIAMIFDYKDYGIDTLDGFITKFNIFTTGNPNINIFNGLETEEGSNKWKHFAISGSIVPACVQKRSPLVDQVTTPDMSFSDKISRFFNEYYPDSDIDVMCNSKSIFEFIDNVSKLTNVIKKNLSLNLGKDVNDSFEIEPIKTLCVIVNTKYIEEQMKDCGDLDYIIKNIETPAIKERFYCEYFTFKQQQNKQFRIGKKGNSLYEHFYKLVFIDDMNVMITSYEITKDNQYKSDSDTYIYLNDVRPKDEQVPEEQNILLLKISENIKFKIKSPHLSHCIEVFRTRYEDYFSVVSKFHLPCVRSYFDGNNVYMLPSCITALMTMTNLDYKYFAGIRDPIDIISKYKMRGFGTIINEKEKGDIIEYHNSVNKWKGMFSMDNGPKNKNEVFGYKKLNDNIFKPGKFLKSYPEDSYRKIEAKYVLSIEDIYEWYKKNYAYVPGVIDFLKLRSVKEDGMIEPVKKWLLDCAYEELSK